jgi:hypothetical protein
MLTLQPRNHDHIDLQSFVVSLLEFERCKRADLSFARREKCAKEAVRPETDTVSRFPLLCLKHQLGPLGGESEPPRRNAFEYRSVSWGDGIQNGDHESARDWRRDSRGSGQLRAFQFEGHGEGRLCVGLNPGFAHIHEEANACHLSKSEWEKDAGKESGSDVVHWQVSIHAARPAHCRNKDMPGFMERPVKHYCRSKSGPNEVCRSIIPKTVSGDFRIDRFVSPAVHRYPGQSQIW